MYLRFKSLSCGSSFSICVMMRSMLGVLRVFSILISFLSSCRENALRCSNGCMCVARSRSTSWSKSVLFGENTPDRCSAKRSAFSLSRLAHDPGGVVYLRTGGNYG
jgi:hypothetical protein